jgi:alpha-ketoglutarate-dependent taurine dioxygenase
MAILVPPDFPDLNEPAGLRQAIGKLREDGLATFSGVSDRAVLREVAGRLLRVYAHPDCGPDGVTAVTGRGDDHRPGLAGFTSAELRPHTDRSGVPEPPLVVMLACVVPAEHGGESLMVDANRLYGALGAEDEEALRALSRPRSALFGGAGGYLGAIFERDAEGHVSVRLRLDELSRFSPDAARVIPRLVALAEEHTLVLPLRAGQGYILNNARWLHGRTRFSGTRTMLRILGNPLPALALRRGFTPSRARLGCGDYARN